MKRIFSIIVAGALISLFVATGCSTKFNIAAPYKNVTVVYGLLDEADTAHYIRIEKAFMDQNKSALTMATSPDSSFYSSLNVVIKRIYIPTGLAADTIHLNRVDLDSEGYPKQPGTFFTAPNYAYKFKNLLDPNYIYRIMITNPALGVNDSADAQAIDDQNTTVFSVSQLDVLLQNTMDFATTGPNDIGFTVNASYSPASSNIPNPVAIAEAYITFNWYDSNAITGAKTPRSYQYGLGYTSYGANNIEYQPLNLTLYNAISEGLGTAPANTFRLMDRCNLSVYVSTQDFANYEQAALTAGTGLTGDDIEPEYTNIKGANTIGLYTSRGERSGLITIDKATIDSLIASPLLTSVKIAGTIYH